MTNFIQSHSNAKLKKYSKAKQYAQTVVVPFQSVIKSVLHVSRCQNFDSLFSAEIWDFAFMMDSAYASEILTVAVHCLSLL